MKLYLITTQIVYFVAILPWIFFWAVAFVLFTHAPTSINTFFFTIITLYPVVAIVCTIIAWYFHLNKRSLAIAVNLIPAIWLIIYFIY